MWHYSNAGRHHPNGPPGGGGAQSAYDLLLGLRGVAITLLYLDLNHPEHPVAQIPGFVEDVRTNSVTLGLAAPLPTLPANTRFGVEVMAGPGILRFQTSCAQPPGTGATRILLTIPRQIESIQRRRFSRAAVRMPIAFSPITAAGAPSGSGGIGHALDLSAGGLRMDTPSPITYGQQLYLSFNTPDGGSYRGIRAKVARCQSERGRCIVGVQFLDLSEEIEQQLVQSVFRLQIKGLAKR